MIKDEGSLHVRCMFLSIRLRVGSFITFFFLKNRFVCLARRGYFLLLALFISIL